MGQHKKDKIGQKVIKMKQEAAYERFFKKLESDLRKEFQGSSLQELRISNNFALLREYNVAVEFRLTCGMKVAIVCDTTFPDHPPKAFCCQGSWSGLAIDSVSKEIGFAEFYSWPQNKKLLRLATQLNTFFETHPPKANKNNETLVREIEETKVLINQSLLKIDRESLIDMVDHHEKAMLYDSSTNRLILMRAREVEEVRQRMRGIIDKIAIKTG